MLSTPLVSLPGSDCWPCRFLPPCPLSLVGDPPSSHAPRWSPLSNGDSSIVHHVGLGWAFSQGAPESTAESSHRGLNINARLHCFPRKGKQCLCGPVRARPSTRRLSTCSLRPARRWGATAGPQRSPDTAQCPAASGAALAQGEEPGQRPPAPGSLTAGRGHVTLP